MAAVPEGWAGLVLLVVVAVVLGAVLSAWVQRHVGGPRRAKGSQQDRRWHLDAGLRVLDGDHPGLSQRWRHGRAALEPGRITLRPFRFGVRVLPMAPVEVSVAAIATDTAQRSGWRSAWSVSPGTRLVEVSTTSGARLQLAVVPAATDATLHILVADPM